MINVALSGHAIQSSLSKWSYGEDEANNALNGTSPKGYAFHTQKEENAWWMVDLKKKYLVSFVDIYLRDGLEDRNKNLAIEISTDLSNWKKIEDKSLKDKNLIYANLANEEARFVKISVANQYLHLKKVEIYADDGIIKFRDCILSNDPRLHPAIRRSLVTNSYEREEIDYVLKHVSSADRILELGASIGAMSTIVSRHCQLDKYTAVEANMDLIEIINKNYELNNVKCDVINAAVSDKAGIMDFYIHDMCWSSSLTPCPNPLRIDKLNAIPLKTLLKYSEANFLICDIEGGEYAIFNKDSDLDDIDKVCLELHPAPLEEMRNLYDFFIKRGFVCEKGAPSAQKQYVCFFQREAR